MGIVAHRPAARASKESEPIVTSEDISRPILLVSLPRSGSTWVANVLRHAVGVHFVSEPADAYRWPAALKAKFGLAEYPTPSDFDHSKSFRDLWKLVAEQPSYFNLTQRRANLIPWLPPTLIRRAVQPRRKRRGSRTNSSEPVARLGSRPADKRLLIKDVTICFCAGDVAKFLDADVVVLRRDLKKVAASWEKMKFPPEPVHETVWAKNQLLDPLGIEIPPLKSHAERLAWTIGLLDLALMLEAEKRDWLVITHEDLVTDPEVGFHSLANDLGLEPTAEMWSFLAASGSAAGTRFETNRTPEQLRESATGVFNRSEQESIDHVLDTLADHLPPRWSN